MCDKPDTPAAAIPIFAIEKAKITKDILDEKALAASTSIAATSILQFL